MDNSTYGTLVKKIKFLPLFALLAFGFLSFVCGAVYLHHYPKDNFISNSYHAFIALKDVYFSDKLENSLKTQPSLKERGITIYLPNKADNGVTLFATTKNPFVFLMDMNGKTIHKWNLSEIQDFRKLSNITVNDAYLFPNGELISVVSTEYETPWGLGVVKVDKNSKIIWFYDARRANHRLSIGEDHNIYTVTHEFNNSPPKWIAEQLGSPILQDNVTILDTNGKEVKSFSILDALRNSPFKDVVEQQKVRGKLSDEGYAGDYTHANFIHYVKKQEAGKFPFLKEGEVLVSLRNLDLILAIDVNKEVVTWVANGEWHQQHEAIPLDNGTLMIFDNKSQWPRSRLIEYNPQTDQITWQYSGTDSKPLKSWWWGKGQVLENKDILITETGGGRLLEITPEGEIVWEYSNPERDPKTGETWMIPFGYRYYPEDLNFLMKEKKYVE